MDGLTAAENREFQARMQRKEMANFVGMFGSLVNNCFESCVNDFTTKALVAKETGCVQRCVQKFMLSNARVGERFAELQAQMMQNPPPGS